MSSLYFKYGTMEASKSANLLMTAHNYTKQDKRVLLLKPAVDTRNEYISSRIGISAKASVVEMNTNIYDLFIKENEKEKISAVLVDEVQFFSVNHIKELAKIVDTYDVPVITFGLKNSFVDGQVFEAVVELLYQADNIEEIKSICSCSSCTKKATHHLLITNGKVVKDGSAICVGDTEEETITYYKSVCRKHYYAYSSGDLYV